MALCERFPALTPFQVRRERLHEVCLLLSRLNDRPETEESKPRPKYNGGQSKPKEIRRQAGDDWF